MTKYIVGVDIGFNDPSEIVVLSFPSDIKMRCAVQARILTRRPLIEVAKNLEDILEEYKDSQLVFLSAPYVQEHFAFVNNGKGWEKERVGIEFLGRTFVGAEMIPVQKKTKREALEYLGSCVRRGQLFLAPGSKAEMSESTLLAYLMWYMSNGRVTYVAERF